MKKLTYRQSVELVALNIDCDDTELESVSSSIPVSLVAEIFGVDRDKCAKEVIEIRQSHWTPDFES